MKKNIWNFVTTTFDIPANKDETVSKITKIDKKLYFIYKGNTIATAKCSPNDEFDEEFGTALLLARALKNLKKEHTATTIESIHDYVEKDD